MTIDPNTGKPIIYICPVCERETRGLTNGMCSKCEERLDKASKNAHLREWWNRGS